MPLSKASISAGPGAAARALGIDLSFNGEDLNGDKIWIEDLGIRVHSR